MAKKQTLGDIFLREIEQGNKDIVKQVNQIKLDFLKEYLDKIEYYHLGIKKYNRYNVCLMYGFGFIFGFLTAFGVCCWVMLG